MKLGFLLFAVAVLATACSRGTDSPPTTASAHSPEEYTIAGETDGAPRGCDTRTVASRVAELFEAISTGAPNIEERFFARGRTDVLFHWFSFSDSINDIAFSTTSSPEDLDTYFAKSYSSGSRLVLRGIDFIGWIAEREAVGLLIFFEHYISNQATGGEAMRRAFGKAEYHCPSATFTVMSVGIPDEEQWHRLYRIHLSPEDTLGG